MAGAYCGRCASGGIESGATAEPCCNCGASLHDQGPAARIETVSPKPLAAPTVHATTKAADTNVKGVRSVRVRLVFCATLVAVLVGAAGCASSSAVKGRAASSVAATTTPQATATLVPTAPAAPAPVAVMASGALHVPAKDTPERVALMNAARARLGTSSTFVVNQLESDSAWAVGELTPTSGGAAVFVAFRDRVDGGWEAIWHGVSGGPAGATAADARFSPGVIASIDWAGRPSSAAILAAAKRLAPLNGSGPVTGAKIVDTTQDSKGRWWAAVHIDNNVDGGTVVIYRDGDTWKCFDFGTGLDESALPKGVKLTLY